MQRAPCPCPGVHVLCCTSHLGEKAVSRSERIYIGYGRGSGRGDPGKGTRRGDGGQACRGAGP